MIYQLAFLLVLFYNVAAEKVPVLDQCGRKIEPIGCFKDQYRARALPIQILNGRDRYSNVFNNDEIDWNQYHAYLQRFICSCAKIAFAKGYKVIGIQFYGECWAGPEGHLTYAKHGKSNLCLTQDMSKPKAEQYRKCNNDIVCTGEQLTNYVYRVAPTTCDTYYEPLGCYKDDLKKPRPFPRYIMNERDYSHENWNGKLIDWENWNTYSPNMICRCAKKAKELGMQHFGIQFYGECWAGEEDEKKIFRAGKAPKNKCMAQDFHDCPYNSYRCVGKAKVNSVFRLIKGPVVISTKKRTMHLQNAVLHHRRNKLRTDNDIYGDKEGQAVESTTKRIFHHQQNAAGHNQHQKLKRDQDGMEKDETEEFEMDEVLDDVLPNIDA